MPSAFHSRRQPDAPSGKPFERAEIDRRSDRERAGHQHDPERVEDAREHPDRKAEEQHAEHGLHRIHPCARARQQFPGGGAEHDQRRAHAETQHEECEPAEHRIARLADVEHCRGERRRDARSDDQRRQESHDRDADQRAALLLVADVGDLRLPRARQLQFVETEHAERKQHEQGREAPQDPRFLECGLQVRAGETRDDAGDREDDARREHVDDRQHERAPRRDVLAGARDDAGQDRDHREHARREREQQSEAEEAQQREPAVARQVRRERLFLRLVASARRHRRSGASRDLSG